MRRLMKFLHTMGAIGLMGAMAALLVLLNLAPPPPAALAGYAQIRGAMAAICTWIFLPSLALTLIAGLLALANRAFHSAGWAWLKLATGVVMFEWGFVGVQGPMEQEARLSADALAGRFDPAGLAQSLGPERGTLWVLLAIATANVVLGIWRPRLMRRPA
ncbi:hypothetical protein [Methylobacterium sp. A54F]